MDRRTIRRPSSSVTYHHSSTNNIRYPTSNNKPQTLTFSSKFPSIDLATKLTKNAQKLSNIISITTHNSIYIPIGITSEIILYTLTLIPGIYNFEGIMSSGSRMNNCTKCIIRLILNDQSCIIGGCVQEIYNYGNQYYHSQSFEYQITDGSYDYETGAIQFHKWYFPFNYKYSVVGQIVYQSIPKPENISNTNISVHKKSMNTSIAMVDNDIEMNDNMNNHMSNEENGKNIDFEEELVFRGEWLRLQNSGRSGNMDTRLTNKSVVLQHAIVEDKYILFGFLSIALHAQQSIHCSCYAKLEIELLSNGRVKGRVFEFEEQRLYDMDYDVNGVPYDSLCDQSYDVLNGWWSTFGQIVFYLSDGRECNGFFNGDFFIGQCWDSPVVDCEMNSNNGCSESGKRARLMKMVKCVKNNVMKKCGKAGEKRKKNRGYFEFQIVHEIERNVDKKGKKNKCKKKCNRSSAGETDDAILYRQRSLDSDDD